MGRIVRWFVILLEFDFTVSVKPGRSHQRADHLSRLTHGEEPIGVEDNLPDAVLFVIETAPWWSEPILEVLSSHAPWARSDSNMIVAQLEESSQYILVSGRLYRQGINQVLRLCLNSKEYPDAIDEAHVSHGGIHASETQTVQRILLNGFWWPTLDADVV